MPRVPPSVVAALTVLLALGAIVFACRPALKRCDALEVLEGADPPEGWDTRWQERPSGGVVGPFTATYPDRRRGSPDSGVTRLTLPNACGGDGVALVSSWPRSPASLSDVYVVHVPASDVHVIAMRRNGRRDVIAVTRIHREAGTRLRPTERMTWFALGLGALSLLCAAIAPLRHRRGRRYYDLHTDWKEAVLGPDGRIERPDGSKIGVLDRGRARWAGPVLVAPEAMTHATAFRDGVVVATRDVIAGGHALHTRQATGALRDARWLTAFALAGSALTVVLTRLS
jgi:hypothetical protein